VLNWNDEFVPLNWIVDPIVLEKSKDSWAWLETSDRIKLAIAIAIYFDFVI
jgi:hypothetical protein